MQSDRQHYSAEIASGAALSGALDINSYTPVAIQVPTTWTAADITFMASWGSGEFAPVMFQGVEYTISGVPTTDGGWIALDPRVILGAEQIKVRSGSKATPVNQGAARTVKVVCRGW